MVMPIHVIFGFFISTPVTFFEYSSWPFMVWILAFISKMSKHFPPNLRILIQSRLSLLLYVGIFVAAQSVGKSALYDALDIRKIDSKDIKLIDILDTGYLKKNQRNLVLYDKDWKKISTYEILEPTNQSLGCVLGFKFSCTQEKDKIGLTNSVPKTSKTNKPAVNQTPTENPLP